jgi:cytolysin-activating lysine-acyltransferase
MTTSKPEISEEQMSDARKRIAGATVSKMVASAIGDMVTLYSKDPAHKHFAFADMEWKILPPIVNGQFHIETADDPEFGTLRPIALVTWAKVSDELDARLSAQAQGEVVRLRPQEWVNGKHIWLVDVVGTKEGVSKVLKAIHENQLSKTDAKVPTRDKDGKLEITSLASLVKVMEDRA